MSSICNSEFMMASRSYPSGSKKRNLKKKREESKKQLVGSLEKYTISMRHGNSTSTISDAVPAFIENNDCDDPPAKKLNCEKSENNDSDDPSANKLNCEQSILIERNKEDFYIEECSDSNGLVLSDITNTISPQYYISDPALWTVLNNESLDYFIINPPPQNMHLLKETERDCGGKKRTLTEIHFYHIKQNGEKVLRKWLVLSKSTKCLFCWVCKLFNSVISSSVQLITGFNDWKHVGVRLTEHENSMPHRKAIMEMSQRLNASQRIDCSLVQQHEEERSYWITVLKRVVAVVKFLSLRGLPFFGSDETIGSRHNGNFLGCLEVVAQFDPFLSAHLEKYGNPGRGNVNYLSSTSINEFIDIMGKKVLKQITDEILCSKYFSIIIDSTPDIAHLDQLCFVIRYLHESEPVERFLKFIPMYSHKAENLADLVLTTLNELGIDILNCRGQSFK